MPGRQAVTFQEALEIVEGLPEGQQENLMAILQRRRTESRREALAECIRQAREEYAHGQVRRGTVDDLLRDLDG